MVESAAGLPGYYGGRMTGGGFGGVAAPLGELPLFARAVLEPEPDPLRAAMEAIDPDRLTPREALETLYRIKSLLPFHDRDEALPSPDVDP